VKKWNPLTCDASGEGYGWTFSLGSLARVSLPLVSRSALPRLSRSEEPIKPIPRRQSGPALAPADQRDLVDQTHDETGVTTDVAAARWKKDL
jgi:hypothetical protein